MSPKDVLVNARSLIAKPENWTKGAFALKGNVPCGYMNPKATSFSVLGAIAKAVLPFDEKCKPETWLLLGLPPNLGVFNDDPQTTHSMILERLDRLIEKASTEPLERKSEDD